MIEHQGEINNPYQQRKADKVVRIKYSKIFLHLMIRSKLKAKLKIILDEFMRQGAQKSMSSTHKNWEV